MCIRDSPQTVDTLYCGNTSGVVEVTWQISADEDDGKPFQYLVCWSEEPLGQLDPGQLPEGVASVRVTVPRAGQVGDTMACRLTAIPVSYTHLDVYKRQMLPQCVQPASREDEVTLHWNSDSILRLTASMIQELGT